MINTFLQLSRGLEYWQCWNLIWRPYWNPKWLPFQVLFLHILASGAVRNLIIVSKRMFQGMINTCIRLSRGLEYWKCWNLIWRPYLKPKWLPFQVLFLHILASGAVRNLIVVSKHMFQGMKKTFLRLFRDLEYGICFKPRWPPYWNPKWLPFQALFQHIWAIGAVRNIIVAAKHLFQGIVNTSL